MAKKWKQKKKQVQFKPFISKLFAIFRNNGVQEAVEQSSGEIRHLSDHGSSCRTFAHRNFQLSACQFEVFAV